MKHRSPCIVAAVLINTCFAGTVLAQAASPVITKSFNPAVVALNGNSIATVTVTNPNAALPLTTVHFSDAMPAGIDLISQTGGTCSTIATLGGMFTINPGAETFSSTSNTLAGGQSCTITVSVRGSAVGAHVNTTSQVTASEAPAGDAASGTLTVTGAVVITKSFTPSSVPLGGTSTMSFTLANPNGVPLTGLAFSDTFPAGLQVASPPGVGNSCAFTTGVPAAGATSFTVGGGTVAASGSCTFTVDVGASSSGNLSNTSGGVSSNDAPAGNASNTAILTVAAAPPIIAIPTLSELGALVTALLLAALGVWRLRTA